MNITISIATHTLDLVLSHHLQKVFWADEVTSGSMEEIGAVSQKYKFRLVLGAVVVNIITWPGT